MRRAKITLAWESCNGKQRVTFFASGVEAVADTATYHSAPPSLDWL